jgi:hypothetical protein
MRQAKGLVEAKDLGAECPLAGKPWSKARRKAKKHL